MENNHYKKELITRVINEGKLIRIRRYFDTRIQIVTFCKYDFIHGKVWVRSGNDYFSIHEEDIIDLVPEGDLTSVLYE